MQRPFDPKSVSLEKKRRHLLSLSEDAFRDSVVRPLFLRRGFSDGRDLCGPEEAGKDCYFIGTDQMGLQDLYAVQTKRGNLNLASKASQNIVAAITQLRTCLATDIILLGSGSKRKPTKAFLCASGTINEAAREHVLHNVNDPRVAFLDSSDIINHVDEHMPLFWLGIDAKSHPYLSRLRDVLTQGASVGGAPADPLTCPVTSEFFVGLQVYRVSHAGKKQRSAPETETLPVVALRTRPERLAILLGEAGSGKSTALKRICCIEAERGLASADNPVIPVLLKAVELAQDEHSLDSLLYSATTSIAPSVAFTIDDMRAGRVLVTVDALDEIPTGAGRQRAVAKMVAFHEAYPACKVIVTCRNYSWLNAIDGIQKFSRFHMLPISWEEATRIVRRLQAGETISETHASEILRRLQDIHGLELNPLLVSVFASTSQAQRVDIPANITEMFKKFTEVMLGRWDAQKGFRQQYHAPLKDFLLRSAALYMHSRGLTAIAIDELESMLMRDLEDRGHKPDALELTHEVIHRSGLFRVLGNMVEFSHLMLQEFFAGRGLDSQDVGRYVGDEWWQRALVFHFGDSPDRHQAIEVLCGSLDQRSGADLAQRCLVAGLALQACYLVKTHHKRKLLSAVLRGSARATKELCPDVDDNGALSPIMGFIRHYVVAREGLSVDLIRRDIESLVDEVKREFPEEVRDQAMFWIMSGLVECGYATVALEHVRGFRPHDDRLLLALHLGFFLLDKVRIGSKSEKQSARAATRHIAPKIQHLRERLLAEVKSELIESRRGKLTELDAPQDADEN